MHTQLPFADHRLRIRKEGEGEDVDAVRELADENRALSEAVQMLQSRNSQLEERLDLLVAALERRPRSWP